MRLKLPLSCSYPLCQGRTACFPWRTANNCLGREEKSMPEKKWTEGEKERLRERLGGEAHTSASNTDYEFLELELL